jgi:hypothetical protein
LEIIYWAEKYETTSPHHDFFFSIYIKFLKKVHPFLICKSPYSLGLCTSTLGATTSDQRWSRRGGLEVEQRQSSTTGLFERYRGEAAMNSRFE